MLRTDRHDSKHPSKRQRTMIETNFDTRQNPLHVQPLQHKKDEKSNSILKENKIGKFAVRQELVGKLGKIPKGWSNLPECGDVVRNTKFIPIKVLIQNFKTQLREKGPSVTASIPLSSQFLF